MGVWSYLLVCCVSHCPCSEAMVWVCWCVFVCMASDASFGLCVWRCRASARWFAACCMCCVGSVCVRRVCWRRVLACCVCVDVSWPCVPCVRGASARIETSPASGLALQRAEAVSPRGHGRALWRRQAGATRGSRGAWSGGAVRRWRGGRVERREIRESGVKTPGAPENGRPVVVGGGQAKVLAGAAAVSRQWSGCEGGDGAGEAARPRGPGQAGASRQVERRPRPLLAASHCTPEGSRQGAGPGPAGAPPGRAGHHEGTVP